MLSKNDSRIKYLSMSLKIPRYNKNKQFSEVFIRIHSQKTLHILTNEYFISFTNITCDNSISTHHSTVYKTLYNYIRI